MSMSFVATESLARGFHDTHLRIPTGKLPIAEMDYPSTINKANAVSENANMTAAARRRELPAGASPPAARRPPSLAILGGMWYYWCCGEVERLKNSDVFMITARTEDVEINKNELAQRLNVKRGYTNNTIESCKNSLMKIISYKCAYIRTSVDMSRENICDFGFMRINSKNLYKNLSGCSEAFVMALTAGMAVDRELAKLKITSQAEHFITDAIASAAIDSFCDYASGIMKNGLDCAVRFSPGYGDLSLTFQKPLLERLNAQSLLGISLSPSYLMTPMKSITAIMGIKNEEHT